MQGMEVDQVFFDKKKFVMFTKCDTYTIPSILIAIIWEISLYLFNSMPILRNHVS